MTKEEFIKLIESIGFIDDNDDIYVYKEYAIYLYSDHYEFHNGSYFIFNIRINDLKLLNKYFKMEIRSIKLKQLLR